MNPLYFCYHTPNYAPEVAGLAESLRFFELDHIIIERPDTGSWVRNCAQKADVILEMVERHPDRPLVWLDADARVIRAPLLFGELTCDFAAHWLGGHTLVSATLYFGPSPAARNLVRDWVELMHQRPDEWDQKTLQSLVGHRQDLRVAHLPPEYCWIEGKNPIDRLSFGHYGEREPVIVQWQASRKYRDGRTD